MTLSEIRSNKTLAYVVPLAAFMVLGLLMDVVNGAGLEWAHPQAPWWREWPAQWMYPLQTLAVGALIIWFWRNYAFRPLQGWGLGVLLGIVGIALWILPSWLHGQLELADGGWWEKLGVVNRDDGFDPGVLKEEFGAVGYWSSTVFRFLRAAVVVAFVEELFWRGFLMRFVLDPDGDYWKQPFGKAHWKSYLATTVLFMLIHQPQDYLGALVFGSLMYWLAIRTKSLAACVVMHAVANLLMGIYALAFQQYGLW
ncbi:CAAX prenyl protease-related protein [Rubritalea marina]|uniref:CAAX prenyl protease-related protein n=1 Tax=Rubritalea marina TaxID=361055 RepID=UPI0003819308|nr:CAAX prenyl protease-related protein [Rubritalea marina]